MEITRFNICTDTVHIYKKKKKLKLATKKCVGICLRPCTNGTDTVACGCEIGVRIIDRIINIPTYLRCKRGRGLYTVRIMHGERR